MKYEFCKVNDICIEGWLGDSKEKFVLLVMKEPNNKEVEDFFLKKALYGETNGWNSIAKRTATRMINVFGSIARKIINQDENEEFCCSDHNKNIEVLKKCAFINLSPFRGEKEASVNYADIVNILNEINYDTCQYYSINKESKNEEIALNRLSIIKNIECDYIVVIDDIFVNYFQGKGEKIKGIQKSFINSSDEYQAIKLNGKVFYSFCHHSNRKINYNKLATIEL